MTVTDPEGKTYFGDIITQQTQYETPTLPAGWVTLQDAEGKPYYGNTLTKLTQYHLPVNKADESEPSTPVTPGTPVSDPTLPAGWLSLTGGGAKVNEDTRKRQGDNVTFNYGIVLYC